MGAFAMIIIIDAYNVLKNIYSSGDIGKSVRQKFISQLARYARKKGHTISVVFDAGPDYWPSQEDYKGVKILFSGSQRTADHVIKELLDTYKNKDPLLVSSDRELQAYCSSLGLVCIGSADFYGLMQEALSTKEKKFSQVADDLRKLDGDQANQEIDLLMIEASQEIPFKEDDRPVPDYKPHAKKEKKGERRLLQKIEKL